MLSYHDGALYGGETSSSRKDIESQSYRTCFGKAEKEYLSRSWKPGRRDAADGGAAQEATEDVAEKYQALSAWRLHVS
jgi:hypothetical protein